MAKKQWGKPVTDIAVFDPLVEERGGQPSLVERFSVRQLHKYRDISLSSPFAASVLIARNGSGKTTLLAALDAFLRGHFYRLVELDFSEISCKLRGHDELVLSKDDLVDFISRLPQTEIGSSARSFEVDTHDLLHFLSSDLPQLRKEYRSLNEDPIFSAIYKKFGYSYQKALDVCDRLATSIFEGSIRLHRLSETLAVALRGIEIVYLPTYRRVELPLLPDKGPGLGGRRRRPRLKFGGGNLFAGDIQFGLSDIEERLSDLNQSILFQSNLGYRNSSANIISELLDGSFDRQSFDELEIPTQPELKLFFSRIKEGDRVGPYREDFALPDIDKIYTSAGIAPQTNKFLRFFLGKLSTVIESTKDIEDQVTDFIKNCNSYLSYADGVLPGTSDRAGIDGVAKTYDLKVLRLNRRNLKVYAESVTTGRSMSLDALSSGEKQMVSLFAKLYLYSDQKIVLIDEPELSLSIDWQKKILPDVVAAPTCRQVIAITHSPFIFENELEPFARSLETEINLDAQLSADELGDDFED